MLKMELPIRMTTEKIHGCCKRRMLAIRPLSSPPKGSSRKKMKIKENAGFALITASKKYIFVILSAYVERIRTESLAGNKHISAVCMKYF